MWAKCQAQQVELIAPHIPVLEGVSVSGLLSPAHVSVVSVYPPRPVALLAANGTELDSANQSIV